MISIKSKLTKAMISSFALVSLFSVENVYALESKEELKNFFPLGVYYIAAQKPTANNPAGTGIAGDFRSNEEVARTQYSKEFNELKEAGFNSAILNIDPLLYVEDLLDENGEPLSPEKKKEQAKLLAETLLDVAKNSNIKIVPNMRYTQFLIHKEGSKKSNDDIKKSLLDSHISYFKNNSNVLGFQVYDEPLQTTVNFENLGTANEEIKKIDKNTPMLNTWNDHELMSDLNTHSNSDVVLIDMYPFGEAGYNGFPYKTPVGDLSDAMPRGTIGTDEFNEGEDQPNYSNWINLAQRHTNGKRLWVAVQSFNGDTYYRKISEKELRLQIFMALKNGAKGIFYFLYQSEDLLYGLKDKNDNPTALLDEAKEINKEINKVSEILLKLNKTIISNVNDANDNITAEDKFATIGPDFSPTKHEVQTFVHENGDKYFMAVNANVFNSQDLIVKLKKSWFKNIEGISFVDMYDTEDKFIVDTTSDENNIIVTLTNTKAADGRLIKIIEPNSGKIYKKLFNSEKNEANSAVNSKTFFSELGDLNTLLASNEKFKDFKYSVKINDNNNATQRYQIGIRLGNNEPIWSETNFFGSNAYTSIGDGWQELSFDFKDVVNSELEKGNKFLTRIYVRAYNTSSYVEYEVKDYSITYEKEKIEPVSTTLFQSSEVENKNANSAVNSKSFFSQLGDLQSLLLPNEEFKNFKYSIKINDNNNTSQRYQIGIRLGNNNPSWTETKFYGSESYKEIGEGWTNLEYDFANIINTELSNDNKYLTRIYVRAYNSDSSEYSEYEVKDYSITYEKQQKLQ